MTAPADALAHGLRRVSMAGLGGLAVGALSLGLGSGAANADVDEVGPSPTVTSRQASQNSVIRINDYGVARGIAEARLADAGEISAHGEIRDTTKAVPGGKARPFRGGFPFGPAIGEW
ncbi:MAG: hypothetical protein SW019_25940 [Actinomycetota bacterium]|nr:hypothetical protein [Actinomycetota bacterium]